MDLKKGKNGKLLKRSMCLALAAFMALEGVGEKVPVSARTEAASYLQNDTSQKSIMQAQDTMENEDKKETEDEKEANELVLTCKDYSSSSVDLTWTMKDTAEVDRYEVHRDGKLLETVKEETFSDKSVKVADYTYEIKALNAAGDVLVESNTVVVSVHDDMNVTGDVTLTEDKVVKNLKISGGTLNLAGYELIVLEDITQTGGTIQINKGYLECEGNYTISNSSYLNMTNTNDYFLIKGNLVWQPYYNSTLTAGTLEVQGDYTQKYGYSSYQNFLPGGKHKVLLSGKKKQTISFDIRYYNYFNILELENSSKEGIVCNGAIPALKVVRNDTNIDLGVDGIYGMTLTEDTIIKEDVTLLCGTLDLNGHKLTIQGDFTQLGGVVKPNGGSLEVTGDYYIEDKRNNNGTDTFARSFGILDMTNEKDHVKVDGNFEIGSAIDHSSYLTKGTLEVTKDVIQKTYHSESNFAMTGSSVLLLSGDEKQTVKLAAPVLNKSRIANLSVKNKCEDGIVFGSMVPVSGTLDDGGYKVSGTAGIGAGTKISENSFSGNIQVLENRTINEELNIDGNLNIAGGTTTLGGSLTVGGDLSVTSGTLNLNEQKVTVKQNVEIENGTIYINGGNLACKGNFALGSNGGYYSAYLTMNNAKDYVKVDGTFTAQSCYNSTLTAGTLELKGDFIQKKDYYYGRSDNFLASGNHKTIFSGDKKQTVTFATTASGFQTVEILNESEEGVYAPGGLQAVEVIRNGNHLNTGAEGMYGWTLEEDQTLSSDLVLISDTLDLNGHTLTIDGDFVQEGGTVKINGGKLVVKGNYNIQTKKEDNSYSSSTGYLVMDNENDVVEVSGNFVMGSIYSHSGKLTAGTLKVSGDFTQKTYNSNQNFASSKAFQVELNGTEKQTVSFSNAAESKVANLKITNQSAEGIVLNQAVYVTGNLDDGDNAVAGAVVLVPGTVVKDNKFNGSIQITANTTLSSPLTIGGNLSVTSGTLNLNGQKVTVDQNVEIGNGTIYINGGNLECKGNFALGSNGGYSSAYLTMNNAKDYVKVDGNFTAQSYYNSTLTAGNLEIKGDFIQKKDYYYGRSDNFLTTGNHKTIFSGDKKQTVTFATAASGFQTVEILNESEEGIYAPGGLQAVEVIRNGNHINIGIEGEYGWKLTKDQTWPSDLVLISDTLDLNGHTLTIEGDFVQGGGTVKINGGKLVVKGNYNIQNKKEDNSYRNSTGYLVMDHENDIVEVSGDFLMGSIYSHAGKLTAGTLKVGGDFTQKTYNSSQNFATSKEFWLELNGGKKQEVNFSNASASKVTNLKITNQSAEGIVFNQAAYVTGNLDDGDNVVTGTVVIGTGTVVENNRFNGDIQIAENKTLNSALTIGGNLQITAYTTLNSSLNIGKSLFVTSGTLNLNGQKVTVNQNVEIGNGTIYVNGGNLECKGNFALGSNGGYYSAYLTMNNAKDYVKVDGTFTAQSCYNSSLTAGTLEIKGDFIQKKDYYYGRWDNFLPGGNHKTVLSGEKKQTVTFATNNSGFNILEIDNSGNEGVWTKATYVNAAQIILTNGKLHIGNNGIFGWTLQEDEVVEDDVYLIGGDLDLAGHDLTIHGNLYAAGGDIKVNGGTLNVEGDLRLQSVTSAEGAETKTYGTSTARLVMKEEKDKVKVGKNFVMGSQKSHAGYLTAGVLECKGDFTQVGSVSDNFAATGSHKTAFSGNEAQKITFANPGSSYFNELEITNTSNSGVTLGSNMYVKNNLSDAAQKINKSYTTYLPSLHYLVENAFGGNLALTGNSEMSKNVVIGGTLTSPYNLDMKGYTLSTGSLNITGGTFTVAGGNVIVAKNMNVSDYSYFIMKEQDDYVTVAGDFVMSSRYDHTGRLTAGTLEIKGDFTQNNNCGTNFAASGTHHTILSGKAGTAGRNYVQVVTFANPGTSKFQKLTLAKSKSRYEFKNSVESICNELVNKVEDEQAPTKVTGLTVIGKKANTISLTWDTAKDDEGVTGYEVYRGNTKVATTTKTSYTDSGLTPSTTYVYKVYAFDAARNLSEASGTVSETTLEDTESPTIPGAVKIKSRTGSSISICWNASVDNVKVSGYRVYREEELIAELGVTTSYTDKNLDIDTLYSYQVSAVDSVGNESELSQVVKGSVQMPEIVKFSPEDNAQIGGNTVVLNVYYNNTGNSTGNKVQYEYKTEDGWEKINSVLLGQRSYNTQMLYSTYTWDISKVKNGACEIRCTLYDADGNTDSREMTYYVDTTGPEAPESVIAKSENGVVTVSWMASDSVDCEKYDIYRSEKENGEFNKIGTVTGLNHTEYTDADVKEGVIYYYKVKGIDNYQQEGAFSPVASVTIDEDAAPPTVTSITAKNSRVNGIADITVTAEDNIGVTWMQLEYETADGTWKTIGETENIKNGTGVIQWDTTDVEDGDYNVRAYAKDAKGNITGTVIYEGEEVHTLLYTVQMTVDNTGIAKIHVNSAVGYTNYVTLKWDKVSEDDFGKFVVEQLVDGEFKKVAETNTTLGAHIKNLQLEQEYTFRVVGYDDIGNRGIPSDAVTVKTGKDENPPVVKEFYPAKKYFNSVIPISIVATDDVGIQSFKLEYSTDNENWKAMTEKVLDEPKTSYILDYKFDISELTDGKVFVRVYVYDAAGNVSSYNGEPLSNSFYVDKTAPDQVKNLTAEGMNGYVTLEWQEPEEKDIASFRIYRAEEEKGNYTLLADNLQSLKYYDRTAAYGIVYTYKIEVIDNAGNVSEMSNEAVAQISQDTEAPVIHAVSPQKDSRIAKTVEVKAAVTDNVQIDSVSFEYKAKNSEEDIWTELGTVEMHQSSGYPAVDFDVTGLADGEYELRVVATDGEGNVSDAYTVSYLVDGTAPLASELKATAGGFSVDLNWNENKEDDFSHYAVYGKLGSEEEYTLLTETTKTTYQHKDLKAGRTYQYKVKTYDVAGNCSDSNVVSVKPTAEDKEDPVIVLSETFSVRAGSEIKFDGTASYDNVKITSYKWDFGDGTTANQSIVKHKYKTMGKFKGSLTVSDAAGNTTTQVFTVYVRSRISAKVNIRVRYNDGSGMSYSMPNAYIYIEQDGIGTNYNADMYGEMPVVLSAGTYKVKAFKEGYMPVSKEFKVSNGEEMDLTIDLEKGELVTGTITTRRLTLEEIIDLGVDLQDESNWETHVYTFRYRTPESPKMNTVTVNLTPGKVTRIYGGGGTGGGFGGGGCYGTITDVRGKKVVTIYNVLSYLKKMYEVNLQVTNHAEAGQGFDIVNSTATLHLPSGLSLLKTAAGQSLTNDMGTLAAQETKSTTWYIKADEWGNYPLSASFNGTLLPFQAPVSAEIKADEDLFVESGEDNTFTDEGFVSGTPEDYVIRVTDKNGNRLRGAIVTLSSGGKKCQTITNSYGAARLEVNEGDGRYFQLSITCDGYLDYYESYYLNTTSYFDTIKLFRPGEEQEQAIEKNPYLDEQYAVKLTSLTLDGKSIVKNAAEINTAEKLQHNLAFSTDISVDGYELLQGSKVLAKSEEGGTSFSVDFGTEQMEKNDDIFLKAKYGTNWQFYSLNIDVKYKLYEVVHMKYKNTVTDLLTEATSITKAEGNEPVEITCRVLKNVSDSGMVPDHFALIQEGEAIQTASADGKFKVNSLDFKSYTEIYLEAYDSNGTVISRDRLNLQIDDGLHIDDITLNMESFDPQFNGNPVLMALLDVLAAGMRFKGSDDEKSVQHIDFSIMYKPDGIEIEFGNQNGKKKKPVKFGKFELQFKGKVKCPYSYMKDEEKKWKGTLSIQLTCKFPKLESQIATTPPLVFELEGSIKGTGDLNGTLVLEPVEKDGKKTTRLKPSVDVTGKLEGALSPYIGLGIEYIGSVGIYGIMKLYTDLLLLPAFAVKKVAVGGELGLRADLGIFGKYEAKILENTESLVLYEKDKGFFPKLMRCLKAATLTEPQNFGLTSEENYSIDTESLENDNSEWLGDSTNKAGTDSILTLRKDASPYIRTKIITCKDTTMMVYEDVQDDVEVLEDRSRLVYSIYDKESGSWSEPERISDGTTAEVFPDVYTDGKDIYVAWSAAKDSLKGLSMTTDIMEKMEVTVAKYDVETDRFISLGIVTDNEKYENALHITAVDGVPTVVWFENSENDIFGTKGTNAFYKAMYIDGEWKEEEITEESGMICSVDAGMIGTKPYAVYVVDEDKDITTTDDKKVCVMSLEEETAKAKTLVSGSISNTKLVTFNGEKIVSWYEDNKLCYIDDVNEGTQTMNTLDGFSAGDYEFVSDGNGNSSIVYTVTGENNSQIYMANYDKEMDQWGNPVEITDQKNYITDVNGVYVDGQLILLFNQKKVILDSDSENVIGSEDSSFCWMKVSEGGQVNVAEVNYDSAEVIPGNTVTLDISAVNQGTCTVNQTVVSVLDENKEKLAEKTFEKPIQSGEETEFELDLDMPYTVNLADYTIAISADGGKTTEYTLPLGYADLEVTRRVFVEDETYTIEATVENKGIAKAGGTLTFYNYNNPNEVLYTEDIEALGYGEKKIVRYELNPEVYAALPSYDVCVEITTEEEQGSVYNDFTVANIVNYQQKTSNRVIFNYQMEGQEFITKYTDRSGHVTFPANPEREGYVFAGWFAGEKQYFENTVIEQDITLTAKWNVKTNQGDSGNIGGGSNNSQVDPVLPGGGSGGSGQEPGIMFTPGVETSMPEEPAETNIPSVLGEPVGTNNPLLPEVPAGTNIPSVPEEPEKTNIPFGPQIPVGTNIPSVSQVPGKTDISSRPEETAGINIPTVKETPKPTSAGELSHPTETEKPFVSANPELINTSSVPEVPMEPVTPVETDNSKNSETSNLSEVQKTIAQPKKVTSRFGELKARSMKQTNTTVTLGWSRIRKADGYLVYGSRCSSKGKKYKEELLKNIKGNRRLSWTQSKLQQATYYKYQIKAYKLVGGKKIVFAQSVYVYAVTKGGKYCVADRVRIEKMAGKKVSQTSESLNLTLEKGRTVQMKATEMPADKKKKIRRYRLLGYETSNSKVATVTKNGTIKAVEKGTCKIWVYAQNGVYKTITVSVK